MQQLPAVHSIPCYLAKIALFGAVISILRYSDILLDGLTTTAGTGLHRLTQELRNAIKREAGGHRVPLQDTFLPSMSPDPVDVVALNDLMERLTQVNPRQAQVFELRCFGGLDVRETAAVLDVSEATVKNDWRFARAWLASQLEAADG